MTDSLEIIAACDPEVEWYSKLPEGSYMSLTLTQHHSDIKI